MPNRTVTDQALPDGVYPYAVGSGNEQQQRYYAKLANGATKRGFTTARAASCYKKAKDSAPSTPKETRGTLKALWPEYLRARRPYLVPGTYEDYERHGRLRLVPYFGDDKVTAIAKSDVQDWLTELDEEEEFAPKTINNAPGAAGLLHLAGRRSRAAAAKPCPQGRSAARGSVRGRLAAPARDPGVSGGLHNRVPASRRASDRRRASHQRGARSRDR
jgi:hypothetical protein